MKKKTKKRPSRAGMYLVGYSNKKKKGEVFSLASVNKPVEGGRVGLLTMNYRTAVYVAYGRFLHDGNDRVVYKLVPVKTIKHTRTSKTTVSTKGKI